VNFEELDIAIEELETRLERLRALYEQYFLGFEKIEPAVARKDVDRRIYVLRREKIRNTGKRFKLQTIIQRYNTFQQYWQRICREVENGTYKRHVLRAERVMGAEQLLTIAARRRFGKAASDKLAAEAAVDPELPREAVGDASPLDEIEDEAGGDTLTGLAPPPGFQAERGTDQARRPTQIPGTVPPNAPPRVLNAVTRWRPCRRDRHEHDQRERRRQCYRRERGKRPPPGLTCVSNPLLKHCGSSFSLATGEAAGVDRSGRLRPPSIAEPSGVRLSVFHLSTSSGARSGRARSGG
jgi:hypothetical protein